MVEQQIEKYTDRSYFIYIELCVASSLKPAYSRLCTEIITMS